MEQPCSIFIVDPATGDVKGSAAAEVAAAAAAAAEAAKPTADPDNASPVKAKNPPRQD
jgi:hypothetical protein